MKKHQKMNQINETDSFLNKTFKQAGLKTPSHSFTGRVMEQVSLIPLKKRIAFDWEFFIPVFSIVGSIAIIVVIFPSFFLQIFSKAGFDSLIACFQLLIENVSLKIPPLSGNHFLIASTSILSIITLLLFDRIIEKFQKFRSFLVTL